MKDWEKALDKFISDWKDRPEVLGAILTGSYAVGNETNFSDIDVHIVLSDEVDWRERGNKVVDGFLIEYFANPIRQLKKYQEEDFKENSRTDARMYSIGKILFDKDGTVKRLQEEAKEQMKKPFEKKSDTSNEIAKYFLWDQLDNLAELNDQQSPNFSYAYFKCLSKIFDSYANFLQVEMAAPAKVYKYFTDERFRERYQIDKFPDDNFVQKAVNCLENTSFDNAKDLTDYVFEKMGGFNIDGWKIKAPAE